MKMRLTKRQAEALLAHTARTMSKELKRWLKPGSRLVVTHFAPKHPDDGVYEVVRRLEDVGIVVCQRDPGKKASQRYVIVRESQFIHWYNGGELTLRSTQ